MAYDIERWDFKDETEDQLKIIEFIKEHDHITLLIDNEKDRSFVLVGDGNRPELDARQAEALHRFVNSDEFPKD